MGWFWQEESKPDVVICDRLGREIPRIESARDLVGANLKDLNLVHADLAGRGLFGANCEGAVFVGARLDRVELTCICVQPWARVSVNRTSAVRLYTRPI